MKKQQYDSFIQMQGSNKMSDEDSKMSPVARFETFSAQIDLSLVCSHYLHPQSGNECSSVVINYRGDPDSEKHEFESLEHAEEVYEEIANKRDEWEERIAEEREKLMSGADGQGSLGFG